MPPALFAALQFPFTRLGYVLFPTAIANGIIAGSFTFCAFSTCQNSFHSTDDSLEDVLYDCMHYA
jgi:hypothetical protein